MNNENIVINITIFICLKAIISKSAYSIRSGSSWL